MDGAYSTLSAGASNHSNEGRRNHGTDDTGLSAPTNGTGPAVLASNTAGTALQVDGVASFSRSGIAKVAGKSTKSARTLKVTGVALTSSSLILATPQGTVSGVAVEGTTPDVPGSTLSSPSPRRSRSAGHRLVLGWMLCSRKVACARIAPVGHPGPLHHRGANVGLGLVRRDQRLRSSDSRRHQPGRSRVISGRELYFVVELRGSAANGTGFGGRRYRPDRASL